MDPLLRLPRVLAARGIARSSHYKQIGQKLFTPPVRLGANTVGWPLSEVEAINAARIAGKTDDEIRRLVQRLLDRRKAAA
jgi:prophage regulatory protein